MADTLEVPAIIDNDLEPQGQLLQMSQKEEKISIGKSLLYTSTLIFIKMTNCNNTVEICHKDMDI